MLAWLVAGLALAAGVLPFVREDWPAWVLPTVLVVFAASLVGPMLCLGWMIGRVFARGGGWVGLIFAAGLVAGPTGQVFEVPVATWSGYAALALGLVGLVLLAVRAVRRLDGRAARAQARRAARSPARGAARGEIARREAGGEAVRRE